MRELLSGLQLHTICESANCPNLGECWEKATATFLVLGNTCTRRCAFCDVTTGAPQPPDPAEPSHVAEAVRALQLRHAVVTSVTRDDLPDGGAAHFAATIREIKALCPGTTIEVLIPDFDGDSEHLATVLAAQPTILAHNLETVRRLHRSIRPRFRYDRSLCVLAASRRLAPGIFTKSSLMVGLGETEEEVVAALRDLRAVQCEIVTVGQYLAPSGSHAAVVEYLHPDVFARYRQVALELGFGHVASGPFVRSSFDARAALLKLGEANASG